ncbi:hypothetical protein [uncultured Fibrella sp.]|uniref:hypothetical protein n=1 Tax=uncultured Fibrella sp. TaxID=1284596 RepID=UPI0035CA9A5B
MNTSTKHTLLVLAVTAFLGSCSRPVATFQPSKAERFYSVQTPVMPVATQEVVASEPVAVAPVVAETPAAPVAANATINEALTKAEAYASTKARPADARKLERRITKIREVLAANPQQALTTNNAVSQKTTLVKRMMLKSMDKKIQKHLAPEQPMRSSTLTAGLVIGLIGLLLLLLTTGTAATIGLIALVVGIVLVILGLL